MGESPVDPEMLVPGLSAEQREKLLSLEALYAEWNEKINLISRKDFDFFHERHLLHSLAVAAHLKAAPGKRVLDIGTGGGFPGIPLAIAFPEMEFTLVDSIGKKIKVVKEVSRALDLNNVTALHERVEKLGGSFDYAVTRAVARLSVLVRYCMGYRMRVEKLICLKGGDLRGEIREVRRYPVDVFDLHATIPTEFFQTKKVVVVDFRGRLLKEG